MKNQIKYAYLIAIVGAVLWLATSAFSVLSPISQPAGPPGGNPQLGNLTANNMSPTGSPFGAMSELTIVFAVIAFLGLAWLGLMLFRPKQQDE